MAEWQPIETAPKDGKEVLLFEPSKFGNRIEVGSFREDDYRSENGPMWLDNSFDDFSTGYASRPISATHWMPLPDPPREESQ